MRHQARRAAILRSDAGRAVAWRYSADLHLYVSKAMQTQLQSVLIVMIVGSLLYCDGGSWSRWCEGEQPARGHEQNEAVYV